jgi:hypothetical protein
VLAPAFRAAFDQRRVASAGQCVIGDRDHDDRQSGCTSHARVTQ